MPLEHLLGNLFSSALEVWLGQWWWWWMSSTGEGLSPPWDTVAEGPPPPPPPPSTSLLCFPLFFPGSQTPQSVAEGKQRRTWGRGGGSEASSDKDLDPLPDGLAADGAHGEGGAAVWARAVATLEHQLDLVVDADGAGDPLLHLPVAALQLLHQLPLLRGLGAGAALHLCAVCGQSTGSEQG